MHKEEDRIKDYIFQAVQATKQENSGLIAELKKSVESIREEQKKVAEELKDYVKLDTIWKEADKEWKEKAKPVLQMGENVQGFGKVSLYVVGFIASVTGAVVMIINIIKHK